MCEIEDREHFTRPADDRFLALAMLPGERKRHPTEHKGDKREQPVSGTEIRNPRHQEVLVGAVSSR
mgnify:CR=1 FL=1